MTPRSEPSTPAPSVAFIRAFGRAHDATLPFVAALFQAMKAGDTCFD